MKPISMRPFRLAGLAILPLAPVLAVAAPSSQVTYRCGPSLEVHVLYDNSAAEPGRPLAWVHDGTQTHRLPLVRAASGARYSDGHWTWWSKGSTARFERKGKPTLGTCEAGESRRVLIDRRTRTQWTLPAAWTEDRVDEELLLGAEAEAEQPGAQLVARYSEHAATPQDQPQLLARLIVLPTQAWAALAESPAQPLPGELLSRTPTWSYVASLPGANPYPPDTPPAEAYEALLPTTDQMRDDLRLWGQGPLIEGCRISGRVSYRERLHLLPADVLTVQLLDVSQADAPAKVLAERRRRVGPHQVPLRFELPCDAQPASQAHLVVSARIERSGQRLFVTDTRQPVLADGQNRDVDLMLVRVRGKPARPSREMSR